MGFLRSRGSSSGYTEARELKEKKYNFCMDTLEIKPSAKTISHHPETHEDETSDLVAPENPGCGSLILDKSFRG